MMKTRVTFLLWTVLLGAFIVDQQQAGVAALTVEIAEKADGSDDSDGSGIGSDQQQKMAMQQELNEESDDSDGGDGSNRNGNSIATNVEEFAMAASSTLPPGVTMCDNSEPVGQGAAYLLPRPLPYCMNGGTCRVNYRDHPDEPCLCPPEKSGPHCEFEKGKEPDTCSIHCFSGGTCRIGAKSFEIVLNQYQETSDLQYCLCPPGKSGRYCEQDSLQCGDFYCFNGGTCVTVTKPNGSQKQHCDCTTSYSGGDAFAGKYCQHKATAFCSPEPDYNGHQFCVNGGTCRENGSLMGCDCPDGFMGPLCEFEEKAFDYSECVMECQNGGICRKGAKDVSFLNKFGLHRRGLLGGRYNHDFEHCVCPRGFVGTTCEYEMDVCPGLDHVCMHGGSCEIISEDGLSVDLHCDCKNARTSRNRYAGKYCEERSTDFCTIDGEMTPNGEGYDAFCTNGAECKDLVEPGGRAPGCLCSNDNYYGDHCEMVIESSLDGMKNPLFIGLTAGLGAIFILALAILVYRCQKRKMRRKVRIRRTFAIGYSDFPAPPSLDSINKLEPRVRDEVNLRGIADRPVEEEMIVVGRSGGASNNSRISSLAVSESPSKKVHRSRSSHRVTFKDTPGNSRAVAHFKPKGDSSAASATHIGSDCSTGTNLSLDVVKL